MEKEIFSRGQGVLAVDGEGIVTETTTYGPWIDTFGYDSFVANVGVIGTKGQISAIVAQEADASNYSDAASMDDHYLLYQKDLLPSVAAVAASAPILRIGVITKKRYFRLGFTSANNGGSVALELLGAGELNDSFIAPPAIASSTVAKADINIQGSEAGLKVTPPARTI